MEERITVDELRQIMDFLAKGQKVPKIIHDVIFDAAKREVEDKNKVVLIKRDPNIGRDRIQAAYVKIIEGGTIDIHPAIVRGFNADFDGDAMAIYFPITEDSKQDLQNNIGIWNNLISPTDIELVPAPNQDIILGIYSLTKD